MNNVVFVAVLEPHDNERENLGVFSTWDKAFATLRAALKPEMRKYFWFWIEEHIIDNNDVNHIKRTEVSNRF